MVATVESKFRYNIDQVLGVDYGDIVSKFKVTDIETGTLISSTGMSCGLTRYTLISTADRSTEKRWLIDSEGEHLTSLWGSAPSLPEKLMLEPHLSGALTVRGDSGRAPNVYQKTLVVGSERMGSYIYSSEIYGVHAEYRRGQKVFLHRPGLISFGLGGA
jgi:hypothetical protein